MPHISAPGKLFVTGEWAVLEIGNKGMVAAVNKRVHADINEADEISVTVDDFNIKDAKATITDGNLEWIDVSDEDIETLLFTKHAIETSTKYLGDTNTFTLRSWGEDTNVELNGELKKVGFGSSAATVVAVVSAVLAYNGMDITTRESKDIIYKLSAMAHYYAQGKLGSAFDVAASTYGGLFMYQRFDPDYIVSQVEADKSVKEIVDSDWKAFCVEQLDIPDNFHLVIGWTKDSASTKEMITQMNAWRDANEENAKQYKQLYDNIAAIAAKNVDLWKAKDYDAYLKGLTENEQALAALGKATGVDIETQDLKKLSDLATQAGGTGKLSGAGGGDCGIAIAFSDEIANKIKQSWTENDLVVVDATLDKDGVKIE